MVIGARDEKQLRENLGAVGWALSAEQIRQLDEASDVMPCYPHYQYRFGGFIRLNPPVV